MHSMGSVTIDLTTHELSCVILSSLIITHLYSTCILQVYICETSCNTTEYNKKEIDIFCFINSLYYFSSCWPLKVLMMTLLLNKQTYY